jgi:hypothetical protein
MAKTKTQTAAVFLKKEHKKRPGIHSKSASSKLTKSKNYLKRYRGQGR